MSPHINAKNEAWNGGGGERILVLKGRPGRPDLIILLNDLVPGFDRNDPATWQIAAPLSREPKTENTSVYIQDNWRILSNLTLNVGVRWEEQKVFDRLDDVAIDLDDNLAPRVGLIWDVTSFRRNFDLHKISAWSSLRRCLTSSMRRTRPDTTALDSRRPLRATPFRASSG